jgi:nicotinamidase-related amidase
MKPGPGLTVSASSSFLSLAEAPTERPGLSFYETAVHDRARGRFLIFRVDKYDLVYYYASVHRNQVHRGGDMRKCTLFFALILAISVQAGTKAAEKIPEKQMKPALLVIDTQNQYLQMMSEEDSKIALIIINAAIGLFRENGFPVFRVYHTDLQYGPKPGSREFEYPESVGVQAGDLQIIKNYPSSFKRTDLDKSLREKGINTVFLCGLSATGCVLATYWGAKDRDYETFMIKDAVMSHDASLTRSIEDAMDAVGYDAVKVMLENARN